MRYAEITTEGIKYAGSKLKLLPHILQLAQKVQPQTVFRRLLRNDARLAGVCAIRLSRHRKRYRRWSKVFGDCYLLNPFPREHYQELIDHLNAIARRHGWFTEHYGGDAVTIQRLKKPWQRHNTLKLDAIREEIERLSLNTHEKAVALTSLILAMDEVDNTIGHYASYLSEWSPRSYQRDETEDSQNSFRKHASMRFIALTSSTSFHRSTLISRITIRRTARTTTRCRLHACGTRPTITSGLRSASSITHHCSAKRSAAPTQRRAERFGV